MSEMKHFKTMNFRPADDRMKAAAMLNQQLADLSDLASQIKQAHWNVKSTAFYPIHTFFDDLHERMEGRVDEVAERVVQLGCQAEGTMRMGARNSRMPELPLDCYMGLELIKCLAGRFGMIVRNIAEDIDVIAKMNDQTTMDMLIEIGRDMEKDLWFLEAHLQS